MQDDARRKLENQLMVMGLKGLEDPELVPQMAKIINAHPGFSNAHSFYLGMLNGCPQEKRREMYDALLPHLKFKVWPLDTYIRLLKEHASNVESYYNPVKIGTEKIEHEGKEFQQVASPEDAEGILLTMTCRACTGTEDFHGLTVTDAVQVARAMGWKRDLVRQKEICPKCCAAEQEPAGFYSSQTAEEARLSLEAAAERRKKKATQAMQAQIRKPRLHAVN